MKNLFIEYPKCSTCKKAKKFLDYNSIKYEDRNIILDNPTFVELERWIKQSKKDINKFFNTSGMKYRELGLKNKLKNMTDKEKISLLATDSMLIKRPLLITDTNILIGFKEEEWQEIIR